MQFHSGGVLDKYVQMGHTHGTIGTFYWQLSGGYFILLTTSGYGVAFLDVRIIEPQVPSVFEIFQKSTTCL
jgi:hypothetical protein